MKRMICVLILVTLFSTGCGSKSDLNDLSSEEAIKKVLGEYGQNSETGVNKEPYVNDKDEIEINYVIETKSTQSLADTYEKDLTNDELERISNAAMEDISQIMMDKLEELYKNKNIDKILVRIYTKLENDKLFGIRTFAFDRKMYEAIEWKTVNKKNYIYTHLQD